MAAIDLTTVSDVKQWMQVAPSVTADDALIQRLVSELSTEVLSSLRRDIFLTTYTETRNGNAARAMRLHQTPIVSVVSVTIDTQIIPARPSAQGCGFVYDDRTVFLSGYRFCKGAQNIVVGYTAGYAQVPLDLREATTRMCALILKRDRAKIGITSESLAGQQVTYLKEMPSDLMAVLDRYRRVVGRD